MNELHIVFGTGPIGCWTARALRDLDLPVRVINRSGIRPDLLPSEVELMVLDASETETVQEASMGAAVIYQALNPPYHRWHDLFPKLQSNVLEGARQAGAKYVSIENLYMYDSSQVMTEKSPLTPRSRKGQLRKRMAEELFAAEQKGDVQVAALRSSDYFGPGVLLSAMGDRVFGNLVAGEKAQLTGNPDLPHSWAYSEDVGRAAAALGTSDEAFGQVWIAPHSPPATQAEIVELAAVELGIDPTYNAMGPLMMRLGGLFVPAAREMVEMMYEFTEPFVVDDQKIRRGFGLEPTLLEEGIRKTIHWFRSIE